MVLDRTKVLAIGGNSVPFTSLVYTDYELSIVDSKGATYPAPWREGPRGAITPCTVDTIVADDLPTPLPVSTVTNIADPAVVDKVEGPEGSLGDTLGIAGAHANVSNSAVPGPVPEVVTVVVLKDGPGLVFFVHK